MLTLQSVGLVVAVLLAIVALWRARAAARRLERLSESFWELRYEIGQLKARAKLLEITTGLRDAEPAGDAPRAASPTNFISLADLKKKK